MACHARQIFLAYLLPFTTDEATRQMAGIPPSIFAGHDMSCPYRTSSDKAREPWASNRSASGWHPISYDTIVARFALRGARDDVR